MYKRMTALVLAALCAFGILAGCGADKTAPGSVSTEQSEDPVTAQVAAASEMTLVEDVVEEGMEPVYGSALRDGDYIVEMKSSSSMFKVDEAILHVENGQMQVSLVMSSESYLSMYSGTALEAAEAAVDEAPGIAPLTEIEGGRKAFILPVEALDAGLSYAAYSKKKEKWYDRTLLFRADSLPAEAFLESPFTTAADLALEDGTYTVDVALSGGSGKASVQSPAKLTVQGGVVTAEIIWSSKNYDYIVVDGEIYDPMRLEEASVFLIPVTGFDYPMAVQADTTAMSQPHLIDYTLYFDSATIESVP